MRSISPALLLLCLHSANSAPRPVASYGNIPLTFEANQGQFDPQIRFVSRGAGYSIFITDEKAVLRMHGSSVSMRMGNRSPKEVRGQAAAGSYSNYFIGNDPSKWVQHAPNYGEVLAAGIRDGVDLVYHGNQRQLEYDLKIAAGADSSNIVFHFEGPESLKIDRDGDLIIHTAGGDLREKAPQAWQEINGAKKPVRVWHELAGGGDVMLRVAKYDHSKALIIDPVVTYSTYLGGSGSDTPTSIVVDSSGNA